MFETDKDTSLRDFYWKYDREMQKYDTAKYAVTIKPNTEASGCRRTSRNMLIKISMKSHLAIKADW